MMPGPHIPPSGPMHPSRRQSDFPPYLPPQTHSPVPNPYGHYPPPYHGHAPPPPQWFYPQHHYPPPPPHYHPAQQPPPRQFIPHHSQPHMPLQSPMVVSSNPHAQPLSTLNRPPGKSPPSSVPQFERPYSIPQNVLQEAPPPPPATAALPQQQHVAEGSVSRSPIQSPSAQPGPSPPPATPAPSSMVQPRRIPFYPKLPWYSVPDQPFPPRHSRIRRRRDTQASNAPLELPGLPPRPSDAAVNEGNTLASASVHMATAQQEDLSGAYSTFIAPSDQETPITSEAPSEADSTHPTTPSSTAPHQGAPATPRQTTHTRTATKPAVPLIPIKPVVPAVPQSRANLPPANALADKASLQPEIANGERPTSNSSEVGASEDSTLPVTKAAPKSWAELLRSNRPVPLAAVANTGNSMANGTTATRAATVADVIRAYAVESDNKIAFLEPRGLVNTGNMCYMNSILQVLVFCVPFYEFLDQVGRLSAQSFKTPLLDAMILFMREFRIIDSAVSVDQLRLRLKDNELEQYGDAFIPEYVYDVIKRLPRFSTMRRGHQQDAEEFLGFLLEGLHDECSQMLQSAPATSDRNPVASPTSEKSSVAGDGWMEVGPKQKPSVTRSSGHSDSDSPITKIFGGNLRSELRVPGLKNSVTLEPYQPLQLDIGAPTVNNIVDALKGLTRPETLQGDFNSPRGPGTSATKQVYIEALPPVLILHLKRFQYDNTGGTQKIWKKVGYPLELEIPKEVFPPAKRNQISLRGGLPRYRLIAVVYHHGKSAAGGHYTVDVRRQEGREWIRLDDTVIRRVRSEDVAEAGAEDDPRLLTAALEDHKQRVTRRNIYERFEDETQEKDEVEGWNQVNGAVVTNQSSTTNWSGLVNGTSTAGTATPTSSGGKRTPKGRDLRDSKVAYILMYQQIKV